MIVNEVLSKNPLLLKNRIQSKNGCLEYREDASVGAWMCEQLLSKEKRRSKVFFFYIQMNTPFFFFKKTIDIYFS